MSTSALKIIQSNYEARAKIATELRSIDEEATGREYSEDEGKKVTELRSSLSAIDGRIANQLETEVRTSAVADSMATLAGLLHRDGYDEIVDSRSMGQKFAQDDDIKSWINHGARGTSPAMTETRAVTDLTTAQTSGGATYQNDRLTRMGWDFLDRRVFLSDLIPSIQVSTGSVEYVQDVSPLADFADKAVEVTEGAAKPQAGLTLQVITESAAVIAAWVNMTRQVAADAPQLQGYVENRLMYTLKRRLDSQLINGNGTSPNLRGLLNRSGIVTVAPGAAEQRFITIRKAITAMELVEAVPEIIVLNPADAETFDFTNGNSAGIHVTTDFDGGWKQSPSKSAWGLMQVHSTAIAQGTALLIDPTSVALLDRQSMQMFMTDSHASNFTSNILTLLAEVRVGIALFNPKGVARVTFNPTVGVALTG